MLAPAPRALAGKKKKKIKFKDDIYSKYLGTRKSSIHAAVGMK